MANRNEERKNIILLVSGVADAFFSPTSPKLLPFIDNLEQRITKVIQENQSKIFGYVDLLVPGDTRKTVDIFKGIRKQRVINVTLNGKSLLDHSNNVVITQEDGTKLQETGDTLDFILRPEDYEIHICGVDIHGFYKNTITDLLDAGFKVFLHSDTLKRYYKTEEKIKSITHKNFEYCSSRSALHIKKQKGN